MFLCFKKYWIKKPDRLENYKISHKDFIKIQLALITVDMMYSFAASSDPTEP